MLEKRFITERLVIREYQRGDIDDFLYVVRQPEIRATTYGIPDDYPRSRAKKWFRFLRENMRRLESFEFGMFLKDTEKYIGNVGLINISRNHNHAYITYYTDTAHCGQGLTTEAARKMLEFGFSSLGFEKISGTCMSSNPASRRIMEKLGMKYEGTLRNELLKNGVYYDIDHLSILKSEYFTDCKSEDPASFQHPKVESVN